MKAGLAVLFLAMVLLPVGSSQAQVAVGVKGGSMGVGGEASVPLFDQMNGRVGGTFFSYEHSGVYADDDPSIAYDASLNMTAIGALVDYFPFGNSIKLSAGVYYYDFAVSGRATPNESYTIDEKTFQPEKLGALSADVGFASKWVPYAGIGLGDPVQSDRRLTFTLELGALYTDAPQVTMNGEGMIAPTANQAQDFEDGLSDFKFYPVLNLGLSYRILTR